MAVYTEVNFAEAAGFLRQLGMGELMVISPCKGGIENTNYFVTTKEGDFVLTLFERLSFEQLPFYLKLMQHLAQRNIPVPSPVTDSHGALAHWLCGKPASVVNKLRGASELAPGVEHCALLGEMLARMHLVAQDAPLLQDNLRGLPWMNAVEKEVVAHIPLELSELLKREIEHQNEIETRSSTQQLPQGAIHADLFRDNAMFGRRDDGQLILEGVFDFYFAGVDKWLFDIAVCINDWCIKQNSGELDGALVTAFLNAYRTIRAFTQEEEALFSDMLRRAALRFWLSRLWDFYVPRAASLLTPHDPTHFERILKLRIQKINLISDF